MIYADSESILVQEDNKKQNPDSLIRANIKNMLLVVMAINQYVLMIDLERLLLHTQVKMLFTILLIVRSKKVNIVVMWGKNSLAKNL